MKYAVIHTGGKQYRVSEGDIVEVERLASEKDGKVTFSEVLLYSNDGATKIGMPFVSGISLSATIVDHFRGEKIRVAKFKAKARHRRVTGHRQSLTRIKIDTIIDGERREKNEMSAKNANKTEMAAETKVTAGDVKVAPKKVTVKKVSSKKVE